MSWVFTVLLIAVSAATVGFAGWLLRRLFTLEPAVADTAPLAPPASVPVEAQS